MKLLMIGQVTVTVPKALQPIATPAMLAKGVAAVPLFSMSKAPEPPPPVPGLGSETATLIACVPIRFDVLAPAIRFPVIAIGLAIVPTAPAGPPDVVLPAWKRIPAPPGKFVILLLFSSACCTFATVLADPRSCTRIAEPLADAETVELVNVLFEMFMSLIVPAQLPISTPW